MSIDCFTNMPDEVITNILNRLPLLEVVRTSSLARNWRSKWTLLTDVILDEDFFYFLTYEFDGRLVTRFLNRLMGPIRKFVFAVEPRSIIGIDNSHYEQIHEWLLFLADNGIEELIITNWYGDPITFPTQLYSRSELKHLVLHVCAMATLEYFHGFPNLLSLELIHVNFLSGIVWDFIAGCPSLESLKMNRPSKNKMRLWDIAKLGNLKKLHLSLGRYNVVTTITTSDIFHLTRLQNLETITLDFGDCTLIQEANPRMKVPFVSLINIKLSDVDFGNSVMVAFTIVMIRSSPNLKMLDTRAANTLSDLPLQNFSTVVETSTFSHGQLQTVVFRAFSRTKHEITLIKCILACSRSLKTINIRQSDRSHDGNENTRNNWELARKLLKLHRASPTAVVDFFDWLQFKFRLNTLGQLMLQNSFGNSVQ